MHHDEFRRAVRLTVQVCAVPVRSGPEFILIQAVAVSAQQTKKGTPDPAPVPEQIAKGKVFLSPTPARTWWAARTAEGIMSCTSERAGMCCPSTIRTRIGGPYEILAPIGVGAT